MTTHRTCTKCGEMKSLDDFSPHAKGKYGKQSRCRACCLVANKARYQANIEVERERSRLASLKYSERYPEKRRAIRQAWREANPDADKAAKLEWRRRNPEKAKAAKEKWRLENREQWNASGKAWKQRNPGAMRIYYLRKYGLTPETFAELLEKQGGRCAICKIEMKRPCIDHNHETNAVRGLLCTLCNAGLGNYKEKTASLLAAVDYLIAHGSPGMV